MPRGTEILSREVSPANHYTKQHCPYPRKYCKLKEMHITKTCLNGYLLLLHMLELSYRTLLFIILFYLHHYVVSFLNLTFYWNEGHIK